MPDTPAESATDQTDDAPDTAPPAEPGADALGDAGKKALDAMKGKWHSERDRRRELEERIAALETSPPAGDNPTPDVDAIRAEAQREAMAKANARIVRAEVKTAMAGKFANPDVAMKLVNVDAFEVDANGEVDSDEINDAINELLSREPYLAAQSAPRFEGSGGGGARKATGPTQLSRSELDGMSPEQIVAARSEGRLSNLLSGK